MVTKNKQKQQHPKLFLPTIKTTLKLTAIRIFKAKLLRSTAKKVSIIMILVFVVVVVVLTVSKSKLTFVVRVRIIS